LGNSPNRFSPDVGLYPQFPTALDRGEEDVLRAANRLSLKATAGAE